MVNQNVTFYKQHGLFLQIECDFLNKRLKGRILEVYELKLLVLFMFLEIYNYHFV